MKEKTLVLCSAGLDSVVAAAKVKADLQHDVVLFYVAYGSLAQEAEQRCLQGISATMSMPVVEIPCRGLWGRQGMVKKANDPGGSKLAGELAWVPVRNLVLLSLASAYAAEHGFNNLAIGNIAGGIYADNKAEFTNLFDQILQFAASPLTLHCLAPVVNQNKSDVITTGHRLGVPFGLTWSCYRSGNMHCGQCGSCESRKRAWKMNGAVDPVKYLNS